MAQGAVDLGIPGLEDAVLAGRGGYATVYRAWQPAFRRTVAVKVLAVDLDALARDRFTRECHAMGLVGEHPAIVTVLDAGFADDGRPYIVMPFLSGGSLQDRIDSGGRVPWPEVTAIGVRLAGALAAAHEAGVLHRDIKPANVLVSRYGEALLSDFGIARVAGGPETTTGVVNASLAHAAPEILDGGRPTVAADEYSLGSTLFALLTGAPAFAVDTDESLVPMLHRILTKPVPDLRPAGVPDDLAAVLERAMAKQPEGRFGSALAMAAALGDVERAHRLTPTPLVGGETTTDRDRTRPVPQSPPSLAPTSEAPAATSRRRMAVAVAVVVVVFGVGAVALALLRGGGGGRSETVEGELAAGEVDEHVFRGSAGAPYGLRMASDEIDSFLRLFAPDGALLSEDDDSGAGVNGLDARLLGVLPDSGTYRVEVSAADDAAGAYRLDIAASAGTLASGDVVEGRIGTPGGSDVFLVDAGAGQVLALHLSTVAGFDSYLEVLLPDGTPFAQDDDSGGGVAGLDALVVATAPVDGRYVVAARARGDGQGSYRLAVAAPSPLPRGTAVAGRFARPYELALYRFDGSVDDEVRIRMRSNVGVDSQLVLLAPNGQEIERDDDSGGGPEGLDALIDTVLPEDGSYVVVAQAGGGETGSFEVTREG